MRAAAVPTAPGEQRNGAAPAVVVGVWLIAALVAAVWVAGCAGEGPPPAEEGSEFETLQRTIFDARCLSAGCHNGTDRAGDLVLEASRSYADLVGVIPFNEAARNAGLRRVAAGDPDRSFLQIKLVAPGLGQGSRMPLAAQPLSSADIDRIRRWIVSGAPASSAAGPTPSTTPSPTVSPEPTTTDPPIRTPTHTATATEIQSATATMSATATGPAAATPTFTVDSTFARIRETVFTPNCLSSGCHNAQDRAGDLNLEPGSAFGALVGVTPANSAAEQDGLLRVDPGNADNSFLLRKLTLPTAFDLRLGSRMPMGREPLSPTDLDRLRAWILRGALSDETQ